jgi:hypothetical protein
MTTKAKRITYWVTTAFISLMMLFAGYSYIFSQEAIDGFHKIGFPDFFRVELAIAKILGAAALLLPIPARVKEWAYAGFAITFISAFITHISVGDPLNHVIGPVIAMVLLVASYQTKD